MVLFLECGFIFGMLFGIWKKMILRGGWGSEFDLMSLFTMFGIGMHFLSLTLLTLPFYTYVLGMACYS